MKIQLTKEESEKHFFNALCNGSDFASYGKFDTDEKQYVEALQQLKKKNPKEIICFEEVWMQILRNGGYLKYIDCEDKSMNTKVTLKHVHNRVCLTPIKHLMDAINEQDDAVTVDCILQTVTFKEVIFG